MAAFSSFFVAAFLMPTRSAIGTLAKRRRRVASLALLVLLFAPLVSHATVMGVYPTKAGAQAACVAGSPSPVHAVYKDSSGEWAWWMTIYPGCGVDQNVQEAYPWYYWTYGGNGDRGGCPSPTIGKTTCSKEWVWRAGTCTGDCTPPTYSLLARGDLPSNGGCNCKKGKAGTIDPIDIGSGNVSASVVDFISGDGRLRLERFYNSNPLNPRKPGGGWQFAFTSRRLSDIGEAAGVARPANRLGYVGNAQSGKYGSPSEACTSGVADLAAQDPSYSGVTASYSGNNQCKLSNGQTLPVVANSSAVFYFPDVPTATEVMAFRPEGGYERFHCNGGVCDSVDHTGDSLAITSTGYNLTAANGDVESYERSGRLTRIVSRDGYTLSFNYQTGGALRSVVDSHNRELDFVYTNGVVTSVLVPGGSSVSYGYTDAQLTSVTYPDSSAVQYQYADANFPDAMTAQVDESGSTYAVWRYDPDTGFGVFNGLAGSAPGSYVATDTLQYNVGTTVHTDSLGMERTYDYQEQAGSSRLVGIEGPVCQRCMGKAMTYDANGYVQSVTDWNNNETDYAFDGAGLLKKLVGAKGTASERTTDTIWDTAHGVPTARLVTDANQTVVSETQWQVNARGQILAKCEVDPSLSYTCTSLGAVPAGVRRWTYKYCDATDSTQCPQVGLLLSATGPRTDLIQTTTYSYYMDSAATGCSTPGGACHQIGDLKQMTDALGHTTVIASSDAAGRPTRITDPNGVNTDLTYTPRGWLQSRSVGGAMTSFTYYPYGEVKTITDPDNVVTTFQYDPAHRLTDIVDAVGNRLHYTLDAAGNKTAEQVTDAAGKVTRSKTQIFNTLGQLTTVLDGLNRTVFQADLADSYDANGNLVHSKNGLGVERLQSFDALNRLFATTENYNGTDQATHDTLTQVGYDALDRVKSVTDPDNLLTSYSYDVLGNLLQLHSPDTGVSGGAEGDVHDAAGNLIQHTDARGVVTLYQYDALDRLTQVSYPAHPALDVTFHYDETNPINGCPTKFNVGHLTSMTDSSGSSAWCYTNQGDVREVRQVINNTVYLHGYAYTPGRRLQWLQYPSGFELKYGYDADGRVSTIDYLQQPGPFGTYTNSTLTPLITAVTYAPFGPVTGYSWAQGGQFVQRTFDQNYNLTALVSSPASGTSTDVLELHFLRDVSTRIGAEGTGPDALPLSETYKYDPLGRLTELDTPSETIEQAFTYNRTGDRASKTVAGQAAASYGYELGSHHLTSVGSTTRTVDANGNTTAMTDPNGDLIGLGYDDRNLLTTVTLAGGVIANYQYNGRGIRVWRTITYPSVGQAATVYDPTGTGNLYGEYFAGDYREYVYLNGIPVAAATDAGRIAPKISYLFADQLNTVRAVTSPLGVRSYEWPWLNNAFGEAPKSGAGSFYTRFPGQYSDVETGLNYNIHRYYDPNTGRYVQSDPIGLIGGVSSYAYSESTPFDLSDPMGLKVIVVATDPVVAQQLMNAYAYLNAHSSTARSINTDLENSPIVYKIEPTNDPNNDEYCPSSDYAGCEGHDHTVLVDPCHFPKIPTTDGPQEISLPVLLGHELGHAWGYEDNVSPTDVLGDNVRMIENPIRQDLGYPLRTRY